MSANDIPLRATAAIQNGELHSLKAWLEEGGSIDDQEGNGETLLHKAAFYGQIDIARFLIAQGLRLDATDNQGFTPLHEAARNGQAAMVKFLIDQGADPQVKTNSGRSALELAIENGRSEATAQVLRLAHAKPQERFQGDELVRVTPKPLINHTLTEVFNFKSGTYLLISENNKTHAESTVMKTFGELEGTGLVEAAEAEFVRQGGSLPPEYSGSPIAKAKLPRPVGA